ncbi:hypothetical protein [Nostoc sp.]
MNAIFGVDPSVAVLRRRTRDRFALGVGGSYGQGNYWLRQLDQKARKSHSANADSEPRVLKSLKLRQAVNNRVRFLSTKAILELQIK